MNSKDLYEDAKRLIPGGVNSPVRAFDPYPFFISEGEGSRITDVDGNEYLDYCLGYGPLILGHKPPVVMKAILEQLKKGTHFGIPNKAEIKLAEKIVSLVPCAEMIRFTNSGTEATSSAIRLARAYTNREKILIFDGCYHGAHDHFLFDLHKVKSPGIPESIRETTLVAPFNDLERVKSLSEENELATIIVEPVMGNAGCIPPEDGFLEGLRNICNDNDILLFFDEVITGFRLSLGGAQEYFNVTPDLVTLGKIIGGGFPIGGFAGKKDIMKLVKPEGKVFHAGTFSGHPVTMTAGLATLKELENQKVIDKTTKYAEELAETLREESGKTVNQIASMLQIFFTESEVHTADDVRATDKKAYKRFHQALLKKGVFIPPARSECWFVSSAHSKEDLKITKEVLKETFNKFE